MADISRATSKSPSWCSRMLKRAGYRMMLRRYTFALNETQKAQRKQMALDFERVLFEDPDFIKVFNNNFTCGTKCYGTLITSSLLEYAP